VAGIWFGAEIEVKSEVPAKRVGKNEVLSEQLSMSADL
jgi:hypothetical protein